MTPLSSKSENSLKTTIAKDAKTKPASSKQTHHHPRFSSPLIILISRTTITTTTAQNTTSRKPIVRSQLATVTFPYFAFENAYLLLITTTAGPQCPLGGSWGLSPWPLIKGAPNQHLRDSFRELYPNVIAQECFRIVNECQNLFLCFAA